MKPTKEMIRLFMTTRDDTSVRRFKTGEFKGKCPVCVEEGKTSTVHCGGTSTTLLGWSDYYDPDGKHHSHDPNQKTTDYHCSNRHFFIVGGYAPCPTCGITRE